MYENRVIIQAGSPEDALRKALVQVSHVEDPYVSESGLMLQRKFQGFTHIVPFHDEIKSGCGVEWLDRTGMTNAMIVDYLAGEDVESAIRSFDSIKEDQTKDFPRSPSF